MRPVERGDVPTNADGSKKSYTAYSQARGDLIERMGQYCSYCNQKLPASLAVEHVQPKSLNPELELSWENFLLGCTNCNSTKGSKPVDLDDFLWPDKHNTHIAFQYTADGKVSVSSTIADNLARKAQNLLDLVGLQKYPNSATASDRRWTNRKAAFAIASETLNLFISASANGAEEESIRLIGILAAENGFFSIWLDVFKQYPEVRKQIIKSFEGTATDAFDSGTQSIPRTSEL